MKFFKLYALLAVCISISACQNPVKPTASSAVTKSAEPVPVVTDTRPKAQIAFLQKVKANSGLNSPVDATQKDEAISSLNKFVTDSLKDIKNWEFTVTGINDNPEEANSLVTVLGNAHAQPIYNLGLVSEFEQDTKADSIAIDNRLDFTYTTPKKPKNAKLTEILKVIKSLRRGDKVLVSGAIMHINDKGKVDLSEYFDDSLLTWNLDILISDIHKKQ